jgi:hypothetical protein
MLQRFAIASGLLSAAWALNGCAGDSCTVLNNADGTATIRCEDGTSATIANGMDGMDGTAGMDGMDGMNGMNGMDGTSCSVTDNGDGTKTISCTDGTMVIVSDGADGMDGIPGMDGTDAPVTVLFAVVTSTGTLNRGFGATAATRMSAGTYEVVFDRDVIGCSYVATVGNPDLGVTDGTVDLAPRFMVPAGVFVQTRDLAGTLADRNFHLQVACPAPMP